MPAGTRGSIALAGTPAGRKMGVVKARRGHMTLLPVGAAYQFYGAQPGVVLLQTLIVSCRRRPTIWSPTGRPLFVKPHGTEMTGSPVTVMP